MDRRRTVAVATGVSVAAVVALAVALLRKADPRQRLASQFAVPHGTLGEVTARVMPMAHRVFYAPAAERLRLRPEDILLDVGCGSGAFLQEHAGAVGRVAGIDLSGVQIRLARRRLDDRIRAGTAEIVEGDAGSLPWDDATFTAVTCMGSLDWFDDPAATVAEMHRVLAPGGRLVVTYGMDDRNEAAVAQAAAWGMATPSEAEARALLEDAGFEVTAVSCLPGDVPARYLEAIRPSPDQRSPGV
jgi:SAM-dependent methyltransferase